MSSKSGNASDVDFAISKELLFIADKALMAPVILKK